MSVMLKRAVEERVAKLEKRLKDESLAKLKEQFKSGTEYAKSLGEGKHKTSVLKQMEKVKAKIDNADPETAKEELALWKPVLKFIGGQKDYQPKVSKKGKKGKKTAKK